MKVPHFLIADLLVFWGGAVNNFNAYSLSPINYAKDINIPAFLIYGKNDPKVTKGEIDNIYQNLQGKKKLVTFEHAGHANYLDTDKEAWKKEIKEWMEQ
jgi:esterase/lipase